MKLILFVLCIYAFSSCLKENGKKESVLTLILSNGESFQSKFLIAEKIKNYKNHEQLKNLIKSNPNVLYCLDVSKNSDNFFYYQNSSLQLTKVKEKKLLSLSKVLLRSINSQFTDSTITTFFGPLELIGDYTKRGRCYNVENGTFKFDWANAEDYGKQDTTLTGTWTLKRL